LQVTAGAEGHSGRATPLERLWADNDEGRTDAEPAFVVDVDGFEGPLDLLLHLARGQKVDLSRISVLALAEQYIVFIERARALSAGTCGGLSRHGGVACLSEVEAADPQAAR
jgi:segregation and condensation protein A